MSEGINFIKCEIKGKDIFLNAMKTWDIPEENEEEKAARIELEDKFKTRIILQEYDPEATIIRINKNISYEYGASKKIFPKSARETISTTLKGLSLEFKNFYEVDYLDIYFNALPEKNLTRLIAMREIRWDGGKVTSMYLLRTIAGDPLKLHELLQKFKDEINSKAKDLW